uniref:Uncharacterized protein n=1 Tax=Parastrongyloides trichosuri TaxID=131310 RepID=A0A0N4ZWC8_PARTI
MLDKPSNKKIRERRRREKEDDYYRIPPCLPPPAGVTSDSSKGKGEKEGSRNIFKFKRRVFKSGLGKSLTNLHRTDSNRRSFEKKKIEDSSRSKTKHKNPPGVEKEYHSAVELTTELSTGSVQNDNSC